MPMAVSDIETQDLLKSIDAKLCSIVTIMAKNANVAENGKRCGAKEIQTTVNQLVDAVNELQTKVNKLAPNINFAQPDVKENFTTDPDAEQKWVGCLCKLWTGDGLVRYGILRGVALNRKKTNYPYQALSTSFEHCEPVKPDDDIIYKGE